MSRSCFELCFFIIITIISLFIESFIHSGPPMAPRGKKTTLIRKAHFGISFSPSLFSFSSSSISSFTRLILLFDPKSMDAVFKKTCQLQHVSADKLKNRKLKTRKDA